MISQKQVDLWFTYVPPVITIEDPENPGDTKTVPDRSRIEKFHKLREAGHAMATVILENTPSCPDQSTAIRKIREAVMLGCGSISFEGK